MPKSHKLPGEWAIGWLCCQECGTTERRHKANGLCLRCYSRVRAKQPKVKAQNLASNRRNYPKYRARIRERTKAWAAANVEKRREHRRRWEKKLCLRPGKAVELLDGRQGVCIDKPFRLTAPKGGGSINAVLIMIDGKPETIITTQVIRRAA